MRTSRSLPTAESSALSTLVAYGPSSPSARSVGCTPSGARAGSGAAACCASSSSPTSVMKSSTELGGGGEYTRVSLPAAVVSGVYPMGYAGLGGEINVTRRLKLGATLRMLATTRPTFASTRSGSIYGSSAESALTGQAPEKPQMQYDIAAEAQFHVRYTL